MRRAKWSLSLLALGSVVLSLCIWQQPVTACWRRVTEACYTPSTPSCIPQVIYVFVEREGSRSGPPRVDEKSRKVNILFILDTDDADIGPEVAKEAAIVEQLLLRLRYDQRGQFVQIKGDRLTRGEIEKAIRDMPVGPNESLLVYGNLHGASSGAGQELQMRSASEKKREVLPRKDLLDLILAKKARLTMLITDACYGTPPTEEDDPFSPTPKVGRRKLVPSDNVNRVLTKLLVEHKGVVNINSCARGEYAWTGVFSQAFVDLCNEAAEAVTVPNWKTYFEGLRTKTMTRYLASKKGAEAAGSISREMDGQKEQTPISFKDEKESETLAEVEEDDPSAAPAPSPAPVPGEASTVEGRRARLTVHLPEGARLFVDDHPTTSRGTPRELTTPALDTDAVGYYTLRAELDLDGKVVTEQKRVPVQAGKVTTTHFEELLAAETARRAELTVRLPAGARLSIDGQADQGTGPVRVVRTAPLPAEGRLVEVRVVVPHPDGEQVLLRRVRARAGDRTEVDFSEAEAAVAARP